MATVAKSDASRSWRGCISCLVEIELKAGSSRKVAPVPRRSKPTSTASPFQFHAIWFDVALPLISIPARVQSPQGTSAIVPSIRIRAELSTFMAYRHQLHMQASKRGQMNASVAPDLVGYLAGVCQR